jgi:nucleotidyltransferase/DNA polymerase involved in DNA repair
MIRQTSRKQSAANRNGGEARELRDLVSIGPAMLRDFERIGVRSVAQLARAKPETLYEKLCQVTGQRHDICCLDVFSAAVAQARNAHLPAEQRQWWYWSRLRKKSDR